MDKDSRAHRSIRLGLVRRPGAGRGCFSPSLSMSSPSRFAQTMLLSLIASARARRPLLRLLLLLRLRTTMHSRGDGDCIKHCALAREEELALGTKEADGVRDNPREHKSCVYIRLGQPLALLSRRFTSVFHLSRLTSLLFALSFSLFLSSIFALSLSLSSLLRSFAFSGTLSLYSLVSIAHFRSSYNALQV